MSKQLNREKLKRAAEEAAKLPAYMRGELGANAPTQVDVSGATEIARLRAELAATQGYASRLVQALKRLRDEQCRKHQHSFDDPRGAYFCTAYCETCRNSADLWEDVKHSQDCPVTLADAALAEFEANHA